MNPGHPLFFRASASCSKLLNVKSIFNTTLNSMSTLFLRASASYSKLLNNKKDILSAVNSGHPLFFRARASCSKILNNEKYIFRTLNQGQLCFSGQAQVAQNSWIIKIYAQHSEFRASASYSKILNDKKIFQYSEKFQANSIFQGKRKLLKNPEQ